MTLELPKEINGEFKIADGLSPASEWLFRRIEGVMRLSPFLVTRISNLDTMLNVRDDLEEKFSLLLVDDRPEPRTDLEKSLGQIKETVEGVESLKGVIGEILVYDCVNSRMGVCVQAG